MAVVGGKYIGNVVEAATRKLLEAILRSFHTALPLRVEFNQIQFIPKISFEKGKLFSNRKNTRLEAGRVWLPF